MGAYKGKASTFKDADSKEETFKKGGKVCKKKGGAVAMKSEKKDMKDMKACGGKAGMRADRPARKSGGAVFSSAASGTKRGAASHY
jgi:hypothetical protein